jgi:hypothetical protein
MRQRSTASAAIAAAVRRHICRLCYSAACRRPAGLGVGDTSEATRADAGEIE